MLDYLSPTYHWILTNEIQVTKLQLTNHSFHDYIGSYPQPESTFLNVYKCKFLHISNLIFEDNIFIMTFLIAEYKGTKKECFQLEEIVVSQLNESIISFLSKYCPKLKRIKTIQTYKNYQSIQLRNVLNNILNLESIDFCDSFIISEEIIDYTYTSMKEYRINSLINSKDIFKISKIFPNLEIFELKGEIELPMNLDLLSIRYQQISMFRLFIDLFIQQLIKQLNNQSFILY